MKKNIQIAIDGPAGAGKSTIAKIVAEQLGFTYIDTGAMYRAVTYKALKENIKLDDEKNLEEMLLRTEIELKPSPNGQLVFVDGEDVTKKSVPTRSPQMFRKWLPSGKFAKFLSQNKNSWPKTGRLSWMDEISEPMS